MKQISVSESSATSDRDAQPSTSKQNEQATRYFQVGWLHSYPWLSYENGLMHCKQRRELKFTNTMAQGTNNFRTSTSTLTRHVSDSDHQRAMAAPNEQKRMSVAAEKALSKEEEAVQVAMKAVFWLCQESLPLHKYLSFLSFLLNVPHIEHLQ